MNASLVVCMCPMFSLIHRVWIWELGAVGVGLEEI